MTQKKLRAFGFLCSIQINWDEHDHILIVTTPSFQWKMHQHVPSLKFNMEPDKKSLKQKEIPALETNHVQVPC